MIKKESKNPSRTPQLAKHVEEMAKIVAHLSGLLELIIKSYSDDAAKSLLIQHAKTLNNEKPKTTLLV
jgi:hypothetical protein